MTPGPPGAGAYHLDAMSSWPSESLRESRLSIYWNETVGDRPAPTTLTTRHQTDLVVVGAGFTGLWVAMLAAEENPVPHPTSSTRR